jgi:hypothetical protein
MHAIFWVSLLIAIVAFATVSEIGFLLARRAAPEACEQLKPSVAVVVAAMLGLLALLLGFTFNMVDTRFTARRQLVIEDANAIGTAYLRASLLPPPHDARVAELFREYVAMRVTPPTRATVERDLARAGELQDELWNEARAITAFDTHSQVTNLFVAALNNVIDAHAARVNVGLYQRLPIAIRVVLYVASLLAFGVVGYSVGLTRRRAPLATIPFIIAVATVMTMIVEVNRPLAPALQVELKAYRDLQQQMERDRRAAAQAHVDDRR